MNSKQQIVANTASYVKETLSGESTGHDWHHIERVRKLALRIGREERADLFIVELGALLHDIADWKFYGDSSVGAEKARAFLQAQQVEAEVIDKVCYMVENISFKGGTGSKRMHILEGKIVQDADRLDAMGAIGVARCFAFGGYKGRELYNPDIPPMHHKSFDEYKKYVGTSLNHFDEKLLLLLELMNTEAGRRIAQGRHDYLVQFKERFLKEWEGEM
ncbi:MAG: HD domain-containing protein [Nanoarchaeota archaeon]